MDNLVNQSRLDAINARAKEFAQARMQLIDDACRREFSPQLQRANEAASGAKPQFEIPTHSSHTEVKTAGARSLSPPLAEQLDPLDVRGIDYGSSPIQHDDRLPEDDDERLQYGFNAIANLYFRTSQQL